MPSSSRAGTGCPAARSPRRRPPRPGPQRTAPRRGRPDPGRVPQQPRQREGPGHTDHAPAAVDEPEPQGRRADVQHPVAQDHHQPHEAAARQALRQVDYGHNAQRAVVTQEPQASPMSASSSRLVSGGRPLSLIRQAREDDPGQWFLRRPRCCHRLQQRTDRRDHQRPRLAARPTSSARHNRSRTARSSACMRARSGRPPVGGAPTGAVIRAIESSPLAHSPAIGDRRGVRERPVRRTTRRIRR